MSGWRYLLQRLHGDGTQGPFLHTELPLTDVSITNNLSATNELTAAISPALASVKDSTGKPLFDEWGTLIWAEADGQIRGGGIVSKLGQVGSKYQIQCIGKHGYIFDLPYTESWFGVEVDPLDVYREVWRHVQAQPDGNIGLQIPATKTGLKIGTKLEQVEFDTQNGPVSFEAGPVKLNWYETHDLGQFVQNLADDTPFDYRQFDEWNSDGTGVNSRIELGYPRLGRRLTDMRFVVGENILIEPSVDRDGLTYASDVLVLGAGSGRTMIKGYAHQATGKVRRVRVVEDKALRSLTAANQRAKSVLKTALVSGSVASVTLRNSGMAPTSAIQPGDEIYLQIDGDWEDVAFWCRVTSIQLSPEKNDDATLSVIRSDQVA
jgi:hypothetical protein